MKQKSSKTKGTRKEVKRRVERFSGVILQQKMTAAGLSISDLVRTLARMESVSVKPNYGHIRALIRGERKTVGSDYLTLFAKVFKCRRDDFFIPTRAN